MSAAFNAATELIPCDGAGVLFQGSWTGRGHGPVPEDVEAIVHLVAEQACGRVWQSHELRRLLPDGSFGGAVGGVVDMVDPLGMRAGAMLAEALRTTKADGC